MAEPVEGRPAAGGTPIVRVHLKVVPGASREALAGRYGDRLKLRVTVAAESGKANRAVLALLARTLGVPPASAELIRGTSTPLKTVEIRGVDAEEAARLLYGEP